MVQLKGGRDKVAFPRGQRSLNRTNASQFSANYTIPLQYGRDIWYRNCCSWSVSSLQGYVEMFT